MKQEIETKQQRLFSVINGSDNVITFSSENPYLRSFGYEVLSHSHDAIDPTYMQDGLPILVDHNSQDAERYIGILENVRLENGKLTGDPKFSEANPLAIIVKADVDAGIRKNVSIGYQIKAIEESTPASETEPAAYLVTKWMPFEVSFVTVPADISVGVGRRELENIEDAKIDSEIVKDIKTESQLFIDTAGEAEFENEKITNTFEKENIMTNSTPINIHEVEKKIDTRDFNLKSVIEHFVCGSDLPDDTLAISNELYKTMGGTKNKNRSVMIPLSVVRAANVIATNVATAGGNATPQTTHAIVPRLREASAIMRLGAQYIYSDFQGTIRFPLDCTANRWNMLNENASVGAPTTAPDIKYSVVSPKLAIANIPVTGTSVTLVPDIMNHLMTQSEADFAEKLDALAFAGTGSAEPFGLLNLIDPIPVPGPKTAVAGAALGLSHVQEAIKTLKANKSNNIQFAITPGYEMVFSGTPSFSGSTYPMAQNGKLLGYQYETSCSLPGTAMLAGDFSKLNVIEFGALEMVLDQGTAAEYDITRLILKRRFDIYTQQPTAFYRITGAMEK